MAQEIGGVGADEAAEAAARAAEAEAEAEAAENEAAAMEAEEAAAAAARIAMNGKGTCSAVPIWIGPLGVDQATVKVEADCWAEAARKQLETAPKELVTTADERWEEVAMKVSAAEHAAVDADALPGWTAGETRYCPIPDPHPSIHPPTFPPPPPITPPFPPAPPPPLPRLLCLTHVVVCEVTVDTYMPPLPPQAGGGRASVVPHPPAAP